ncbi:hypothetical protein KGD82_13575 [Nocardiopsis eucommiae]|uniref:Uncharacterized protein n=1 Tax=Nocardiopsis eucommiae TaxID=2831970 RepID=A0A975LBY3_9ACTN|nr:hypothetical protein KGD82_13575 [Nocardiopsis eucommiae]
MYATDEEGAPTDGRVADILMQATLYQAEHGSPELSGGKVLPKNMRTVKIDQISYTAATDPVTGRVVEDRYSPRAVGLLRVEGLVPAHPRVV